MEGKNLDYFINLEKHVQSENRRQVFDEFDRWWNNHPKSEERAACLKPFSVPQSKGTNHLIEAVIDTEKQEFVLSLLGDKIHTILKDYSKNEQKSKTMRRALKALLAQIDRLKKWPMLAANRQCGDAYHLLAAQVVVFQLIQNPSEDNAKQLLEYAQTVSGHPNPGYQKLGALLGILGLLLLIGALVLHPQLAFTPLALATSETNSILMSTCIGAGAIALLIGALTILLNSRRDVSACLLNVFRALPNSKHLQNEISKERYLPLVPTAIN